MKNGINSHDIVIKNMKTLIKNNINCYIHMVTHPFNVGYIYDSVIHLYNLGIKNIAVGIVETTIDIDNNFVKSYVNQMKKVSDYILDNNINDIYISELMQIKPLTDIRTYIYDDDGKLVGETYGRSGEDITKTKDYKVVQPYKSNNAKYIEEARLLSYNYHNKL